MAGIGATGVVGAGAGGVGVGVGGAGGSGFGSIAGVAGCVVGGRGPGSLYGRCLEVLAKVPSTPLHTSPRHPLLPDPVLLDLFAAMFKENPKLLIPELSNLSIFSRILKSNHCRLSILKYFQAVTELDVNLSNILSKQYSDEVDKVFKFEMEIFVTKKMIDLGLRLGGFLNDAGWYIDAEITLMACKNLCQLSTTVRHKRLLLECCHRLLHAQSSYRCFSKATVTYDLSCKLLYDAFDHSHLSSLGLQRELDNINDKNGLSEIYQERISHVINGSLMTHHHCKDCNSPEGELNNLLIRLFKEFAIFYFLRSNYNDTFKWSMKSLELLRPNTPIKIVIDVLCICGKACVMMRKFSWAELLIQQAVVRARFYYGQLHPKYAFTLLDYGFYFLNVDSVLNSVTVYEEALAVLKKIYHGANLHVAIAHEDLSYALYVHEYSSGRFYKAREHVDKAIKIMETLLPEEHLMLATTKRVKALILEEIALDTPPFEDSAGLLTESERLHKSALELSLNAFGEMNVQTAKQYGNLGRLYQSMRKFSEAEAMQKRAIDIKEKLLGPTDYEVGLSLGHLASLYNYHMRMFTAAEDLYYRSISISLKSFGEEYSGLEYDYIGLIHVNTELKRPDRSAFYTQLLHQWRRKRDISADKQHPEFRKEKESSICEIQAAILEFNEPWDG